MNLPLLEKAKVSGKTVFLRVDLDVPLSKFKVQNSEFRIEDDTRLVASLKTIEYLLKHNAKIIISGHLGRPKPVHQALGVRRQEFSLLPVAHWFVKTLKHNSQFIIHASKLGEFKGWEIGHRLFLLENLRFYPGEEANDPGFAKKLASLADIYVNDAFAMCHRNHASVAGVPKFLPHFAGLRLQKEVETLTWVIENPKRPLVVIIGGKKIETKLPLVEKMRRIADYVLVGGKIASESKVLVKVQHEKIVGHKSVLIVADTNVKGFDITEKDAENFLQIISLARTIIWNGSMGIIGTKRQNLSSEAGTKKIAEGILKTTAYSVVGGGDTVEFLNKLRIINRFSFVSTGGGAMLSFLSQKFMPGLKALTSTNKINKNN